MAGIHLEQGSTALDYEGQEGVGCHWLLDQGGSWRSGGAMYALGYKMSIGTKGIIGYKMNNPIGSCVINDILNL